MIMDSFGIVILAAGEGKRLKLNVAKSLAPLQGKRLIDYPLDAASKFLEKDNNNGRISVILGNRAEEVNSHINDNYTNLKVDLITQDKQLGTGDAVKTYMTKSPTAKNTEYTIVMCADTPLIGDNELSKISDAIKEEQSDAIVATFETGNPTGYGRVVRSKDYPGLSIIEEKEANDTIKKIQEVNSGLYIFRTSFLLEHLNNLNSSNKANEFYLTDVFSTKLNVKPVLFNKNEIFFGVNTLEQLEKVSIHLRRRKINELRNNGVRFLDSSSVYVDDSVVIEKGVTVYPSVMLEGKTLIGEGSFVEAGSIIKNSEIGKDVVIKSYCHIEDCKIESNASVGPFARLRPGAILEEDVKVGNFVEIKKSHLSKGSKVSHLSYVGDSKIGESTNIGCGFITCNYDGVKKHKTTIGSNCFIGSDTQMIAPVEIGDNSFVASGSTINQSMPEGSFAISRCRQETKEGMAKKFLRKNKK